MNEIAGLPMAEYLRLPAVSASILKTGLERCWRAAWWESWLNPNPPPADDTAASDIGTIAHEILLEGSEAGFEVIDPNLYPTRSSGNIPDGWTNKEIKEARDFAREQGKVPILLPKMVEIRRMVDSARTFIESLHDTEPAIYDAFQPYSTIETDRGGDSELTMLWDEFSYTHTNDHPGPLTEGKPHDNFGAGHMERGAIKCRIRPDRTSKDRKLIVDAKFTGTSAEPDSWGRTQMVREGHYINAALYRRGFHALFGTDPEYVYLVTETAEPYLSSLVGIEPHGYDVGAAKIETALREWAQCVKTGIFPGYPARVCYPEIPAWVDSAWQERELAADPFARRVELGTQG